MKKDTNFTVLGTMFVALSLTVFNESGVPKYIMLVVGLILSVLGLYTSIKNKKTGK